MNAGKQQQARTSVGRQQQAVTDSNGNECTKAWGQGGKWGGENDDGKHKDGEAGRKMRMMTGQGGSDVNKGGVM